MLSPKSIFFCSTISCLLLGCIFKADAQSKICGTDAYYEMHPTDYEYHALVKDESLLSGRSTGTISVVFHIVWKSPDQNLTNERIQSQLNRLNLDFNNPYLLRENIPLEFRDKIANPSIKFCLANKGPDGQPHSGITRKQTEIGSIGNHIQPDNRLSIHYTSLGGTDAWNPQKYLNIWVGSMDNIFGRSTIGGTVYKEAEDGIVIDPGSFGTLENAINNNHDLGRTLIHEMGHYLGLRHLWGNRIGCDGDDLVDDTPTQRGPYFGCPSYPQRSCGTSNMFMNFMDYADDACLRMFTKGQVRKMNETLAGVRRSLIENNACSEILGPSQLDKIAFRVSGQLDLITLVSPVIPNFSIQLLAVNLMGQTVYSGKIEIINTHTIYTHSWPSGIYFLYLRYNKESKVIKLLIH